MVRARPAGEPLEGLLVRLFDRLDRALTQRQLRDLGETGVLLLAGVRFSAAIRFTSVACQSCGEDHAVDLEFDTDVAPVDILLQFGRLYSCRRGRTYYLSLRSRMVVRPTDHLLRIARPDRTCLIDNVMWRLGTARLDQRFWTAMLVRDVHAASRRHSRAATARTAVATQASCSSAARMRRGAVALPNDYRWLPLRQLLHAETGHLEVASSVAFATRFGPGSVGKAGKSKPGRPGVAEHVIPELRRRAAAGEMHETLAAEATASVRLACRKVRASISAQPSQD